MAFLSHPPLLVCPIFDFGSLSLHHCAAQGNSLEAKQNQGVGAGTGRGVKELLTLTENTLLAGDGQSGRRGGHVQKPKEARGI